jgi:hypothetical protein
MNMKILVGAACVAVIALAFYIIGCDILKSHQLDRQTFSARCNQLIAEGSTIDPSAMDSSEKSKRVKQISECLDFLRTGTLP